MALSEPKGVSVSWGEEVMIGSNPCFTDKQAAAVFHPDKEQLRRLRFEALATYPQARPNCFVVSSPAGGSSMFILLVGESQGKLER